MTGLYSMLPNEAEIQIIFLFLMYKLRHEAYNIRSHPQQTAEQCLKMLYIIPPTEKMGNAPYCELIGVLGEAHIYRKSSD